MAPLVEHVGAFTLPTFGQAGRRSSPPQSLSDHLLATGLGVRHVTHDRPFGESSEA